MIIALMSLFLVSTAHSQEPHKFFNENIDNEWAVIGLKFDQTEPFCFAGTRLDDGGKFMLVKTKNDIQIRITTRHIPDDDDYLNFGFVYFNDVLSDVEIGANYGLSGNTISISNLSEEEDTILENIIQSETWIFFLNDTEDQSSQIKINLGGNGKDIRNALVSCGKTMP